MGTVRQSSSVANTSNVGTLWENVVAIRPRRANSTRIWWNYRLDHPTAGNGRNELDELAQDNPHVQRLMTIPGVGRKTAEVLVAAIDDPHRFRNAREVSSDIGLVPEQYQSGQTDRHGRITKRGSRLLRTMLVECAWAWRCGTTLGPRPSTSGFTAAKRARRKKAGIALARKLAVVAWAMMSRRNRLGHRAVAAGV